MAQRKKGKTNFYMGGVDVEVTYTYNEEFDTINIWNIRVGDEEVGGIFTALDQIKYIRNEIRNRIRRAA